MRLNVNGIEREATSEEVATIRATQADMEREAATQAAALQAAAAARTSAKTKLAALGLTEAEVAALLGA